MCGGGRGLCTVHCALRTAHCTPFRQPALLRSRWTDMCAMLMAMPPKADTPNYISYLFALMVLTRYSTVF